MRDRVLIFCGLVLFVALVTYPLWHGAAAGTNTKGPDIKLPTNAKTCVEPLAYMRASHMALLIQMREDKVRRNVRTYKASDGKVYDVSLTKTCLEQCHGSREQFCDRCHEYTSVSTKKSQLFCWDCHTDVAKVPTQVASINRSTP